MKPVAVASYHMFHEMTSLLPAPLSIFLMQRQLPQFSAVRPTVSNGNVVSDNHFILKQKVGGGGGELTIFCL
jgi:hypothetical protein